MNVVGKISLGLAIAGVFVCAARADDVAPTTTAPADTNQISGQPYATIVARNIFGLVPIPPPVDPAANQPPPDPPPKITANGIMTIFGQLQALFKVTIPAKPGEQAKESSYMLSEGQRQDDIEVEKIDEKAATITFNNHGTEQEIPLVVGQATSSDAPAAAPGMAPPQNPFAPRLPRFAPRPPGFPGGSPFGGGAQMAPPGQNNNFQPNNNNNSPVYGGGATPSSASSQQPASNLTMEEQAILIETERARLQSMANPEYDPNLLPPTQHTPPPP